MYKAILLDLDGTTIPNKPDGKPSQAVIKAIQKAQKKCAVSVVTGRPYALCKDLLSTLSLTSLCVVDGGAQIVDPQTGDVVYENVLAVQTIEEVLKVLTPFSYKILSSNPNDPPLISGMNITETPKLCLVGATKEDTIAILELLTAVPEVAAHPVTAWIENRNDIHITNISETKKHTVENLLEMLKIEKKESIGVGDSNNDVPLFESVGFKVAMGNATPELQSLADYVCPSVEDDGVVDVIERYILGK